MITAKGITKIYPIGESGYKALNHVDLEVKKGEFLAIMGPSGSGKSTLLQLLGGLDLPTEGELTIDGIDMAALSEKQRTLLRRRKMGFVFQNYQLLPMMTVEENIAFPMSADRSPKAEIQIRVPQMIKAVGLEGKERSFPSQLSGGQQQRVAIARALALQPRLILADEPTGNLDRKSGREILELLSKLHRDERLTIVMVTHDLYAASFAERVILLKDGQIEADIDQKGGSDDVVENILAKLNA